MPFYRFHYRQTEYRVLAVTADTPGQALEKYMNADGEDSFVQTGADAVVLAIDEYQDEDTVLCVFDSMTEPEAMTDPATAIALYNAMRLRYLCDKQGV